MEELIAFVTARLDEAAARAWAVHDVEKCDALLYEEDMAAAAARDPDCDCGYPARVLREVEAGRKILRLAAKTGEWTNSSAGATAGYAAVIIVETLHALAAVDSGHPEYRPEWKP